MSSGSVPSSAPGTTPPAPDILFDDVKNQTERELQKLKTKLGVNETDDKHKKWDKIKEVFIANKETITKITHAELEQLKEQIHDDNNILPGTLEVQAGALVYNEVAPEGEVPSTTASPEIPTESPPLPEIQVALPVNAQEEIANYQPDIKNSVGNWIRDAIINFIGGIFPEWAARMRGFSNANVEKRAENAYNTITGDEGRNILGNSPLSNILVLDHIDKNAFKKILAQYPNLDFSNKRNIEAAFLGKHADKPELIRYHRIYEGMRKMCNELSRPEGITYNPEERLKTILSYSRDESISVPYMTNTDTSVNIETIIEPQDPTSPEAQRNLIAQATEVDEALTKAQSLPESTEEEKKAREEAIKTAEENLKKFKEERKESMISIYTDVQNRIKNTRNMERTLVNRNSSDESESRKLEEARNELRRLEGIETRIKTEIDNVLMKNGEKWEIKDGINAERITSSEIAISNIEHNIATVENSELSEAEKQKQEKEKKEKIEENRKLLSTDTIISTEKMKKIEEYLEKNPNPELQEKFEVMKSKIALVKMTVQKKNEMRADNHFINWENDDADSRGGWVEIDDSYSGGSALEDISWLELDADGFAEVDWQLVRGDNDHVKKVGGLYNARNILNANKEIIRKSENPEELLV